MAYEGERGGGGGASGWKILLGLVAVIILAIYMYTQASKDPLPEGQKRRPLDILGVPSRIPMPSSYIPYQTPAP